MRQRATLPHPLECSTIAVPGLSFQVRNGGWASPRGYDHRKIIFNYQNFSSSYRLTVRKPDSGHDYATGSILDTGDRSFPCYLNVLQTDRKECITLQRLVRVSSTPHRASTSRLSSTSSLCRFPNILSSRNPHLGERFPLRCFQRLSYPDLANRQRPWQDDRHTRDPSTPVLSY